MKIVPVLGEMVPDPVGLILGTGMEQFKSKSGIDGLARVKGTQLELLAVVARKKGKGHFRKFIAQCQKHYTTICVWHDMNPFLGAVLQRYGFSPETMLEPDGEVLNGWRWDSPTVQTGQG